MFFFFKESAESTKHSCGGTLIHSLGATGWKALYGEQPTDSESMNVDNEQQCIL